MSKRIVIGLSLILFIFFLGGIFIVLTIETSRAKFEELYRLHQAQIFRDTLLINIDRVQTDLYLYKMHRSHSPQDRAKILADLTALEASAQTCFGCHHGEANNAPIFYNLKGMISTYRTGVLNLMSTSDPVSLEKLEDIVITYGIDLRSNLGHVITIVNQRLGAKTKGVFDYVREAKVALYISMFLGMSVAAFMAVRFRTLLIRPIREFLEGAKEFSRGNLAYRIPEDMPQELATLAASFNTMAAELKKNLERTKKVEQMELMKEIAAGLAHEIKNPLTGIRGALEIFRQELPLAKEEQAVFDEMIFQVKKLDIMTKSFLEYARPPAPHFIPTNVNEVLNNTVSFITKQSLHRSVKHVEVAKELDGTMPIVDIDPMQLQQVLMNLIFNAFDAMPGGGILNLKTSHSDNAVEIIVSDSGHGIDAEIIDSVFKPFFTTKTKGTGIGLSICKRLIEQHQGTIAVESSSTGTTFIITLPKDNRISL